MSSCFKVMERTRELLTDTYAHIRTHAHENSTKPIRSNRKYVGSSANVSHIVVVPMCISRYITQ